MIEELLQNPEKYRIGDNYKATNIVFPVEFENQKLIVKIPRPLVSLINVYYTFQDKFFYRTRKISTVKQRFQREIEKLGKLNGLYAPLLVGYKDNIIVKKYLEGKDFRNLSSDGERKKALEGGLERLEQIHEKDIVIGDAHIKNIFLSKEGTYWMDFDGLFNESDLTKSKAIDILKFVYSTYCATRNKDMTLYSTELVSKYSNKEIKNFVKNLVTPGLSAARLWFPVRLPLDGKLNCDIKKILRE